MPILWSLIAVSYVNKWIDLNYSRATTHFPAVSNTTPHRFGRRPCPAMPKGSTELKALVNCPKKVGFGKTEQRVHFGSKAQACSSFALSPSNTTSLTAEHELLRGWGEKTSMVSLVLRNMGKRPNLKNKTLLDHFAHPAALPNPLARKQPLNAIDATAPAFSCRRCLRKGCISRSARYVCMHVHHICVCLFVCVRACVPIICRFYMILQWCSSMCIYTYIMI